MPFLSLAAPGAFRAHHLGLFSHSYMNFAGLALYLIAFFLGLMLLLAGLSCMAKGIRQIYRSIVSGH